MTTEIVKRLNREEAQALTERIRATTETLWELLTKAKEGEAWDTLGYDSWADYVKAEFNMSKQYSYRILHQAMVIHELAEAAGVLPTGNKGVGKWLD